MSQPLVSIIIPCYNAEKWVAEAIQSALDQTWPNKEVIVIDDGSTDGSLAVIQSFGDKIRWETGANSGGCAARNRGTELAQGEWIQFLDADDVLTPHCIREQMGSRAALGSRVLVFGQRGEIDEATGLRSNGFPYPAVYEEDDLLEYLLAYPITTPSVLHSKSLLTEVGGFRVGLKKGQEADLHFRLALAGVKFRNHASVVYHQRMHNGGDRISVAQSARNAPRINIENVRRSQGMVVQAYAHKLPKRIRVLLGRRWWALGRELCRVGHLPEAQECFHEAVMVASRAAMKGSLPYRLCVRMLGPVKVESLFEEIKNKMRNLFG